MRGNFGDRRDMFESFAARRRESLVANQSRPQRGHVVCFLILIMLVSTFLPVVVSAVDVAPAVWTDKPDYQPEETVTIQGSGFSANSVVTITVLRPDGTIDSVLDEYGSPYVTDENGAFTASYTLDGITGPYYVAATDGTNTATTIFTDGVSYGSLCADPSACPGATSLAVHNPTHYKLQAGTGGTFMIVGAQDVCSWDYAHHHWDCPAETTVYIKRSDGYGNSVVDTVTGTISGSYPDIIITFSYTALSPGDVCQTSIVAYKTNGNLANNHIISGGWSAAGFAFVDASGNVLSCLSVSSSVSTEIHLHPGHTAVTSVPVGSSVHDKATVTVAGANIPSGSSVTFEFYENGACATPYHSTENKPLAGGSAQASVESSSTGALAAGSYSYKVFFNSGDTCKVPNAIAQCEVLTVKTTPTISTSLSSEQVTVGTAVTDSADLSGVTSGAGGSIVFKVFSGSDTDCSGTALFTSNTIAVSGSGTYGPSTPNFVPDSVGTYRWQAFYSGDTNNDPATSSCSAEILTVIPVTPTISTSLSSEQVTVGTAVTDSADLSGVTSGAGGSIVFKVFSGSDTDCSGTALFTSNTIAVSGSGTYGPSTPNFVPDSVGTYRWQAFYSGDTNNDPATSSCSAEILTVIPVTPTIVTVVSPSTITLGTLPDSASDTATLSGGFSPTGAITFNVYGPSESAVCNLGSEVFTSTVNVDHGNGQYTSGLFTPSAAGKYWWVASYSGDGNNDPASDSCGAQYEVLAVEPPAGGGTMTVESGYMPGRGGYDPPFLGLPVSVDGSTYLTSFTLTLQDAYAPGSLHKFTAPKTFRANGVTFRFHHWQDESGMRLSSRNSFKYPLQPGKTLMAVYTVPLVTLRVYVYDAVTHKPISGATVLLDGEQIGTTNGRGRLVARVMPNPFGKSTLTIQMSGYTDYTLTFDLVKSKTIKVYMT
jgi:hypothetical protein